MLYIMLFFGALLINWGRQVAYYYAFKKTNQMRFCESYETLWFMKNNLWVLGYIEEVFFAILWMIIFPFFPSFIYGWIFDAIQDIIIALFTPKKSPYSIFGKELWKRELVREVIVPYIIVGPLVALLI